MSVLAGLGPAARMLLASLGVLVLAGVFALVALLVALAGLGRLSADLEVASVPGWFWYFRADPDVGRWLRIGALTSLGATVILVLAAGPAYPFRTPLHGAARWAGEIDVLRAGLRGRQGIVVGERGGRLLTFGGPEHVMLYAPTRTGKGVGVVIPNLLTWPGSLLVLDIKGENWTASAGYRAAIGQKVFRFDPLSRDGRTARFNPLGHINRDDRIGAIDALQKIAVMLFPTNGQSDAFWSDAARVGFLGVGAYIAETASLPLTLGEIYRQLTSGDPRTRFPREIEERIAAKRPLSAACVSALADFCGASDRTFSSIRQTITSRMGLFLNPLVDAATSASDFDLAAMRSQPMSVYLCASPEDLSRSAPLYALLLQLFLDFSARGAPVSADGARVLVVLDEFAKLGPMNVFAQAFSFIAGYGVRLLCVLQSPAQLRANFGPDVAEEVMTNCGVEVVFAPRDLGVAQGLSARIGTYGLAARSHSRPAGLAAGRRSVSVSEQSRALMLPQELLGLAQNELLVLRSGVAPVRGRKLRYYADGRFRHRVLPPPEGAPRAMVAPAPVQASFAQSLRKFEDADEFESRSEPPIESGRTTRQREAALRGQGEGSRSQAGERDER